MVTFFVTAARWKVNYVVMTSPYLIFLYFSVPPRTSSYLLEFIEGTGQDRKVSSSPGNDFGAHRDDLV